MLLVQKIIMPKTMLGQLRKLKETIQYTVARPRGPHKGRFTPTYISSIT